MKFHRLMFPSFQIYSIRYLNNEKYDSSTIMFHENNIETMDQLSTINIDNLRVHKDMNTEIKPFIVRLLTFFHYSILMLQ